MATWEHWSSAYEQAYLRLPAGPDQPCPNCGQRALSLVFTGRPEPAVGYASFWCNNCLQGIVVSRAPIPAGAIVRSLDDPPEDRRPTIPDFHVIS